MDFYKIYDYENVILFDDRMTNITDALILGVKGIKIIGKDDNVLLPKINTNKKDYYEAIYFSKRTIEKLERDIRKIKEPVNKELFNQFTTFKYDTKNERKNQVCKEQEIANRINETNILLPKNKELFKNMRVIEKFTRPEKIIKKSSNFKPTNNLHYYSNIDPTKNYYAQDRFNNSQNNYNYNYNYNYNNTLTDTNNGNYKISLKKLEKIFILLMIGTILLFMFVFRNNKKNR